MQINHLLRRHAVHCAHIEQIGTVFPPIAHRNFHAARFWEGGLIQARKEWPQDDLKLLVPPTERIEFDQQGTIPGMKIADAFEWLRCQQEQQLPDAFVRADCDLASEVDDQGLIAGGLEMRGVGGRDGHGRKVYA